MKENNIFKLILLFITFMSFEGFLKLFFNYHPIIHGFKYVFATIFFLIWIIDLKNFKTKLSYPIALFSIFVFIQLINPLMWQGKGVLLSILGLFYQVGYVPLFFICYKILNKKRIRKLMLWIITLSTISAITAHIQYSIGHPDYFKIMPYQMTQFVFEHASAYGPIAFDLVPPVGWYMAGLIFCVYFFFLDQKRLIFSILAINLLAAILMSGLRFGILLSALALAVFLIFRIKQTLTIKNVKKVAIVAILGIIFTGFMFGSILNEYQIERYLALKNPLEAYIKQRGFTWENSLQLIKNYPLGGGLRHADIIPSEEFGVEPLSVYTGDNYFNIVLGELGILGFISLLILFYFIIKISLHNYFSNNSKESGLIIASLMSIIFVLMIGSIYGTPGGWMFWIFSSIILNAPKFSADYPDKRNKTLENSRAAITTERVFRGSILHNMIYTQRDKKLLDIIMNSRIVSLLGKLLDIIKSSKTYKIMKNIID